MLLSLSVWMLIAAAFIPVYLYVSRQSIEIRQEVYANHFLYEEAQQFLINGKKENEKNTTYGETVYTVHWDEAQKVCVTYENIFQEEIQICEKLE